MASAEISIITEDHSSGEASANVRDHGKAVDGKNLRVVCNYCEKEMSGFYRLKYHLGGVRGDVTPCERVSEHVKKLFRSNLRGKGVRLRNELNDLLQQVRPPKRNESPNTNVACKRRYGSFSFLGGAVGGYQSIDSMSEDYVKELSVPPSMSVVPENSIIGDSQEESLSKQKKRRTGRFFYETGHDFKLANSPSFQSMMNDSNLIPTCDELKGWILKEEVKDMEEYVKKIRTSWADTGCSILLDGWTDENDRSLVSFFADCPEGTIYLHSFDVSPIVHDVEKLQMLLDKVIDDVGVQNVVQIVSFSSEGWVGDLGKKFLERYMTLFWTVDAPHCIGLMLDNIAAMDETREILEDAKTITKFFHGNVTMLNLLRSYTNGRDLIKPTKVLSAMPFLTLDNMILQKHNLKAMFASLDWNSLPSSCRIVGKRVAELVDDHSFWKRAAEVTKLAEPVIQCLILIFGDHKPHMGYIYETMDQVKETIRKNCFNIESKYKPVWKEIDEIWNGHLHSHLHAAGLVLNPNYFYSTNFHNDSEVHKGLTNSVINMVGDQMVVKRIMEQFDAYSDAKDVFESGLSVLQRNNLFDAVEWWSQYGANRPELQQFARRVLSQTCVGVSKYKLNRSLMEKLLAKGNNPVEQQLLTDLAFVHYNMQLQLQRPRPGLKYDIAADAIDPMNEWIVADTPNIIPGNDASASKMGIGKRAVNEDKSPFEVKEEVIGEFKEVKKDGLTIGF